MSHKKYIIELKRKETNMGNSTAGKSRMLDIFYRSMKGECISIKSMAEEYQVSTKSISRSLNEIKSFLSDNRELVGNTELKYLFQSKTYVLEFDNFLLSKELMVMVKILIGSRALSKMELLEIISKLKQFTTYHDRKMLESLINKEIYHYSEVNRDCSSVIDNNWKLTKCINERTEITITYYKMNRKEIVRKIIPIAIIFSEYYFYLIAYNSEDKNYKPIYFRVDRVTNIVEHRCKFLIPEEYSFDEGELRKKIQFMFPGDEKKIRFEFSGLSVQAILDRMPTARIVEVNGDKKIIEATIYGSGIKMYLLSQGSWVRVISPPEFVEEMKQEIEKMRAMYA